MCKCFTHKKINNYNVQKVLVLQNIKLHIQKNFKRNYIYSSIFLPIVFWMGFNTLTAHELERQMAWSIVQPRINDGHVLSSGLWHLKTFLKSKHCYWEMTIPPGFVCFPLSHCLYSISTCCLFLLEIPVSNLPYRCFMTYTTLDDMLMHLPFQADHSLTYSTVDHGHSPWGSRGVWWGLLPRHDRWRGCRIEGGRLQGRTEI